MITGSTGASISSVYYVLGENSPRLLILDGGVSTHLEDLWKLYFMHRQLRSSIEHASVEFWI
jgi:hypothetical protein